MIKKNILKILFILILTYFSSTIISNRLNVNYDTVTLNANIDFFNSEELTMTNYRLSRLQFYPKILKNFSPGEFADRLNSKLRDSDFCYRENIAKKRGATVKPGKSNIDFLIVFMVEENAKNCEADIRAFIISQKKLFLDQTLQAIEDVSNRNAAIVKLVHKYINQSVQDDDEEIKNENLDNFKYNLDLFEKYIALLFERRNSDGDFYLHNSIMSYSAFYDIIKFKETFSKLEKGNIFDLNTDISKPSKMISDLEFKFLTILIFILLFLITYRKQVQFFINKLKKKL